MTLSDKDPRVQAAIELLTQRLEDEFAQSADDCRNEFQQYPQPMIAYGYDAAPILTGVIRPWRQKSLEHISDVFNQLLAVVNELERGNTTAPDVTRQLCREAIWKFFLWTESDRANSAKFVEWLDRCNVGADYVDDDVLMINPEYNDKGLQLVERLSRDFEIEFERRLARLRNAAVVSHKPLEPTAAVSTDDDMSKHKREAEIATRVKTLPKTQEQTARRTPPAASVEAIFERGNDTYDSIQYRGKRYDLTTQQASIVGVLHRGLLAGFPVVKGERILEEAGLANTSRLRDTFRRSNKELWGTLIVVVDTPKGSYRLDPDITPRPEDL